MERSRTSPPDEILTESAVAAVLQLGVRDLRSLIASGQLVATGGGVRRSEVDAFVERCRIRPGQLAHLDPNTGRRATDRDPPLTRAGRPDRRYGRR